MEALELAMLWLDPQGMGRLAQTCKSMAAAARFVTESRVADATQGLEAWVVPFRNDVDKCRYPYFHYTPFSIVPSSLNRCLKKSWGGDQCQKRSIPVEKVFEGSADYVGLFHRVCCNCVDDGCTPHTDIGGSNSNVTRGLRAFTNSTGSTVAGESEADIQEKGEISLPCHLTNCSPPRQHGSSPWHGNPVVSGAPALLKSDNRSKILYGQRQFSRALEMLAKDYSEDQSTEGKMLGILRFSGSRKPPVTKSNEDYFVSDKQCTLVQSRTNCSPAATVCTCGRMLGGQPAYDSESKLRILTTNSKDLTLKEISDVNSVTCGTWPIQRMNHPHVHGSNGTGELENDVSLRDAGPLIVECGRACSCSAQCKYRVTQNGLSVRVTVVRSKFKGWSLHAAHSISCGAFVCEYAGELLTTLQARLRLREYDTALHGNTWQGSALLTLREHLSLGRASLRVNVDATKIGNVARFINHSCDGGNLISCLIRLAGSILPKLAFFAKQDIMAGEELTYSYGVAGEREPKSHPCYCGTSPCKGILPAENT